MAKSMKTFGAAAALAKSAVPAPEDRSNVAVARYQAIDNSQNNVKANQLLVDPSECKLWERHNRNHDRLNETNCRDLIDSFISSGRQESPAWVRRVSTKGPVKYEIISGARRFWTINWLRNNNYPNFRFFIEVRELTDEEAFRLSNLENLDRKDISDYERALDYRNALDLYYHGKQLEMAKRLEKDESWVSRYLTLGRLPQQIANAYADWEHLKVTHAKDLLALLEDAKYSTKLLQLATELNAKHRDDEAHGRKPLSGAEVFKLLKGVAVKPKKGFVADKPIQSFGPEDSPYLQVKRSNKAGINLYVPKTSGAEIEVIVKSFRKCLEDYYGK